MSSYNKNLVFTAACIGMCFFGISMITLGAVLPSLTTKLALDNLQATALVTFLPLGLLGGSLLFGPIVDRFGHKALLLLSCLVVLLGLEGIAFFTSIPLLQVSIIGIGLGGGILNGETNALVADISDEAEKGSRLSLLGAFYGIGALGIPVLLSFLAGYYSFEIILQGTGMVMLIGILFCLGIRFPAPKQPQGFPIKEGLGLLKESSLLLLSFILFFQSGIEGVCNNWTTLYFGTNHQHPRKPGTYSADLYGSRIDRCPLVAGSPFQEDKARDGSANQFDYCCGRLCTLDIRTRFCTCCHRYGTYRGRIGSHFSGHTQHHRQSLCLLIGNGIQCSPCYRSYRADTAEQPHRDYLTGIQYRCIPVYDDSFVTGYASIV